MASLLNTIPRRKRPGGGRDANPEVIIGIAFIGDFRPEVKGRLETLNERLRSPGPPGIHPRRLYNAILALASQAMDLRKAGTPVPDLAEGHKVTF